MRRNLHSFIFTVLILTLVQSSLLAQDWKAGNGNATIKKLNDVQFVTDQIVYGVGNSGVVVKSTDGGETWSEIYFGQTRNFLSLHFFDENFGFVGGPFETARGGSTEMLSKTTDGGDTWAVISSFQLNDFQDMEFLDDQNGLVASRDGEILYTSDAGDSWDTYVVGSHDFYDIHIKNDTTYWAAGESGGLFSTSDSGQTWSLAVDIDTMGLSRSSNDFFAVEFLNEDVGFAVGATFDASFVLKTVDGGTSWIRLTTNNFEYIVSDLEIGPNGEIVMVGGKRVFDEPIGNAIYISKDEGETWDIIRDSGGPLSWSAVDHINGQWIAVGYSGASVRFTPDSETIDGNNLTGFGITDVSFYDENHGLAATGNRISGTLLTTSDGGQTWQETLVLDDRKDFSSISWADADNVWAVGKNHLFGDSRWIIYRSADAGLNWTRVEPDFDLFEKREGIDKVQFTSALTGYIKAEDKLIKTTDGGSSWFEIGTSGDPTLGDYNTMHFIDDNTGWFASENMIAATDDGGASWTVQFDDPSLFGEIREIFFADQTTGYAVMQYGNVMKTIDGGENWEKLQKRVSYDLNDIEFLSPEVGFIVGDGGTLMSTADGGATFEVSGGRLTRQDFYSIDVVNNEVSWISGENGVILSTSNGGGLVTSVEDSWVQQLPEEIRLSQNYPNPFNPSTTIAYSVPERSIVSLKVYNLLGQSVATLLDKATIAAGNHTVRFDAGNLASGIYLYQLNVGGKVFTRQLTLIK